VLLKTGATSRNGTGQIELRTLTELREKW